MSPITFDLIGHLDADARRNYIANSISDSVWQDYSGANILEALRNIGYGINTQDFYNIRSRILGAIEDRDYILGLDDEGLIPISSMIEKPGMRMVAKIQYRMELNIIDPVTGQEDTVNRSISSNQHYTKNELYELASNVFSTALYPDLGEILGYELIEVWRQPGVIPSR